MNRTLGLIIAAFSCFILNSPQSRAEAGFQLELDASPGFSIPQASAVSGSPEAWFSAAPSSRGSFSYPLPLNWESARAPLLHSFAPTWAPGQGLSEWGHGFQSPLKIRRINLTSELDFETDRLETPWGLLQKGSDGYWYVPGLGTRVRVQLEDETITAVLASGVRLTFAAINPGDSKLVWNLIKARDPRGYTTHYRYAVKGLNQSYLSQIEWGTSEESMSYSVRVQYEDLEGKTAWTSYLHGGAERTLDKRISRLDFFKLDERGERLRWSYKLSYETEDLGPSFYLSSLEKIYSSGVSDGRLRLSWGSAKQFLQTVEPTSTQRLDKVLAKIGKARLHPGFANVVDINGDGLSDIEVASDFSVMVQTEDGFQEPLANPRPSQARSECRHPNDPMNTSRTLMPLSGFKGENLVVVRKSGSTGTSSIIVCNRSGELLSESKLDGDFGTDSRVRMVDLNRDGRPDLIRLMRGKYEVSLNLSNGHTIEFAPKISLPIDPALDPAEGSTFLPTDWNGDGFVDLVSLSSGRTTIAYGKGNLVFGPEAVVQTVLDAKGMIYPFTGKALRPFDANGDGLTDLLATKDGRFALLINTGSGLREIDLSRLQSRINFNKFLFADLLGDGRSQLIQVTPDGGVKSLALGSIDNGLLRGIEDTFGNDYQLTWAKGPKAPFLSHRPVVLKEIILKGAGEKPRSVRFVHTKPLVHSTLPTLLGFEDLERHEQSYIKQYRYKYSDDIQGLLTRTVLAVKSRDHLIRLEEQDFQDVVFKGIPHSRLLAQRSGWKNPATQEAVVSQTTYSQYDDNECPSNVVTDAGSVQETVRYTYDRSRVEIYPLLCTISQVETSSGGDAPMRWRYERNQYGQILSATQMGSSETVLQTQTFDDLGRLRSQGNSAGQKSVFDYINDTLLLNKIVDQSGVKQAVNYSEHDQISALSIHNGDLVSTRRFDWDTEERLRGTIHDLYPIPSGQYHASYQYRASTKGAPGLSTETLRTPEGAFFSHHRAVSGLGSDTASFMATEEGFVVQGTRNQFDERTSKKTFAPVRENKMPSSWSYQDFAMKEAPLDQDLSDEFGSVQSQKMIQSGVESLRLHSMEIEGQYLKSTEKSDESMQVKWTDAAGLVRKLMLSDGIVYHYGYDGRGRLKTVTLPSGQLAKVEYDEKGRKRVVSRTGLGSTEYRYDESTNLLAEVKFYETAGNALRSEQYLRDVQGRVLETIFKVDGKEETHKHKYDGESDSTRRVGELGNLTYQEGPEYRRWFTHNADGRLASRTTEVSAHLRLREDFSHGWDGTILSHRVEASNVKTGFKQTYTLDFKQDSLGRTSQVTLNGTSLFDLRYDNLSRLSQVQSKDSFSQETIFDELTKREKGWIGSVQGRTLSFTQSRNAQGLVSEQEFAWDHTTIQKTFAYDASEYLIEEKSANASSFFNYDLDGLRELPSDTFDGAGRRKHTKTHTLSYGANGQIESTVNPSGLIRYVYDSDGKRIAKFKNGVLDLAFSDGFWLRSDKVIQRLEIAGRVVGLLENGVFVPMASDALGTPFGTQDADSGLASAFGVAPSHVTSEALAFVREGKDADTGLVRFGVRDYDPESGQFTSPDPLLQNSPELCIENPVDCNLYSYARNNPLKYIDPTGLLSFDTMTPAERTLIRGYETEYYKGMATGALIGGAAGAAVIFAPAVVTSGAAYVSEASLAMLLRVGAMSPAGIKATEFLTGVIYGLADVQKPSFSPAALRGIASGVADTALQSGMTRGAASALMTSDGRIFMANSNEVVEHSREMTGLLMSLPKSARSRFTGACSEIAAIEKAKNSGASLSGSFMETVSIGNQNQSKKFSDHGSYKPACSTCSNIMNHFSIQSTQQP